MSTRLSIVISAGALASAVVGLVPACGTDHAGRPGGGLLDGGSGTGGSGNPGGDGGPVGNPRATAIGRPCIKASDCGTQGLTCLLPTGAEFDGAGVPNGLCTLDCSADLTAVITAESACTKIDPTAICLPATATSAYCVEPCTIGMIPSGEVKCHNRHDTACSASRSGAFAYCRPACRGDFDCSGRKCDLARGLCVDAPNLNGTRPVGTACDPNATTNACLGPCLGFTSDDGGSSNLGFCSGLCTIGEVGCGVDPTSKGQVGSMCLFAPSQSNDLGDLGFCAQLCDCNDECLDRDFICSAVMGLSGQVGRAGACGPVALDASGRPEKGIACSAKPPVRADSGATPAPKDSGGGGGAPSRDAGPG